NQRSNIECIHPRNAERDRVAPALVERSARSAQKTLQIIAARNAWLDFKFSRRAIVSHLDKGHKKIRHAITQLLHVSMLIGRAFVPIDRDALMHDAAIEVLLFA